MRLSSAINGGGPSMILCNFCLELPHLALCVQQATAKLLVWQKLPLWQQEHPSENIIADGK
jgi:hypothetical protein